MLSAAYPLASYLLLAMLTWEPTLPVSKAVPISEAIAMVEPLPHMTRAETAMFLVNIGKYESHYQWRAIGDHGAAIGLFQVHHDYPGDDSTSLDSQVQAARRHLLVSWQTCHNYNMYASGNCHGGSNAMWIRSSRAKQWLKTHTLPKLEDSNDRT
jgi:hypothetical protein